MKTTRNKMGKKYSALIILIAIAIILNFIVLGALIPQPSAKNRLNVTYIDRPLSKVIARVVPIDITSTSSTASNNINLPNSRSSSDKLSITKVQTNLTERSFLVFISNVDDSILVITNVFVNECSANLEKNVTIPANSSIALMLILPDGIIFARTYEIQILSSEGQSALFYEMVC